MTNLDNFTNLRRTNISKSLQCHKARNHPEASNYIIIQFHPWCDKFRQRRTVTSCLVAEFLPDKINWRVSTLLRAFWIVSQHRQWLAVNVSCCRKHHMVPGVFYGVINYTRVNAICLPPSFLEPHKLNSWYSFHIKHTCICPPPYNRATCIYPSLCSAIITAWFHIRSVGYSLAARLSKSKGLRTSNCLPEKSLLRRSEMCDDCFHHYIVVISIFHHYFMALWTSWKRYAYFIPSESLQIFHQQKCKVVGWMQCTGCFVVKVDQNLPHNSNGAQHMLHTPCTTLIIINYLDSIRQ